MKTLIDVLGASAAFLESKGVPSPRLEAELLVAHALSITRVQVYLQFDRPLSESELESIRALVRRRGNRECFAHVVEQKEFFGRTFRVRSGVLVPRPDTETLVEVLIKQLPSDKPCFVADLGCGSGCIGLTIAAELPEARIYSVDLDPVAIEITKLNVELLNLKARVGVLRGRWLTPIPAGRPVDWVVSNPPYIPTADIETLEPEVRVNEPRTALDGGKDGLDAYRELVPLAAARAKVGVAVEVGWGQSAAVADLFRLAGLQGIVVCPDLGGTPRVVLGRTSF